VGIEMKIGIASKVSCAALVIASVACGISGPAGNKDDDDGEGGSQGGGGPSGPGAGGSGGTSTGQPSGGSAGAGATGPGGEGGSGFPEGNVEWFDWPSQQSRSGSAWGSALTDIANHLPSSYGTTYDDPDLVTFGHETSHGIHAHLRNYENTTGEQANAFYVLDDKAALVVEPNITKSAVAAYVPPSLRDFRYSTYVTGAPDWDDTPLYLWDEWNAYVNGAAVGVNRVEEGVWNEGWRDQSGNLEFVVYAMAVGMAVSELDPGYFTSYAQFREFLKWNTERAMALFAQHQSMPEFETESVAQYYDTLKTSADAEDLRTFIRTTYGDAWASSVMGL
jgi:hypothetical protein